MNINLLNFFAVTLGFIGEVFDFLVKKTNSVAMAYVSLGITAILAVALVVFLILAIVVSCRRKKAKQKLSEGDEELQSNSTTKGTTTSENLPNKTIVDDALVKDENVDKTSILDDEQTTLDVPIPTENSIETTSMKNNENPAKKQPKVIYDDGIPAMPIYRKSKYEKPKTILVKKDKSKLRNPDNK